MTGEYLGQARMMRLEIRPFLPSDIDRLYQICLLTGWRGGDATGHYSDPLLLGHDLDHDLPEPEVQAGDEVRKRFGKHLHVAGRYRFSVPFFGVRPEEDAVTLDARHAKANRVAERIGKMRDPAPLLAPDQTLDDKVASVERLLAD